MAEPMPTCPFCPEELELVVCGSNRMPFIRCSSPTCIAHTMVILSKETWEQIARGVQAAALKAHGEGRDDERVTMKAEKAAAKKVAVADDRVRIKGIIRKWFGSTDSGVEELIAAIGGTGKDGV